MLTTSSQIVTILLKISLQSSELALVFATYFFSLPTLPISYLNVLKSFKVGRCERGGQFDPYHAVVKMV